MNEKNSDEIMRKPFQAPELKVVCFSQTDIITGSREYEDPDMGTWI